MSPEPRLWPEGGTDDEANEAFSSGRSLACRRIPVSHLCPDRKSDYRRGDPGRLVTIIGIREIYGHPSANQRYLRAVQGFVGIICAISATVWNIVRLRQLSKKVTPMNARWLEL